MNSYTNFDQPARRAADIDCYVHKMEELNRIAAIERNGNVNNNTSRSSVSLGIRLANMLRLSSLLAVK